MESRFQLGDIVKIAKNTRYYRSTQNCNPNNVEGTVVVVNPPHQSSDRHHLRVSWHTYYVDVHYADSDLRLVRRDNG